MELEEGKKAQAEREKRLQEQAKKIENLSTMVLYSNRDGYVRRVICQIYHLTLRYHLNLLFNYMLCLNFVTAGEKTGYLVPR